MSTTTTAAPRTTIAGTLAHRPRTTQTVVAGAARIGTCSTGEPFTIVDVDTAAGRFDLFVTGDVAVELAELEAGDRVELDAELLPQRHADRVRIHVVALRRP